MHLIEAVNINTFPFNKSEISRIKQDEFVTDNYPIVYILYDTERMVAYVGESTNAINRMANHLQHPEKNKLKCVYIISSLALNKSAALDIESYLIQYISASGKFKLLNANGGISSHNYYQKDLYFDMFKEIWKKLTFENINLGDLLELENSDIFKYSPYKSLTADQYESTLSILESFSNNQTSTLFVNGSAGTGKTILAIYLIKLLSTLSIYNLEDLDIDDEQLLNNLENIKRIFPQKLEIGFVVPMTSLRATLKKVFQNTDGLKGNMVIGPTDVIKKDYDILIVDEAHRLTRRKSIMGYGSFDEINKKLDLYHSEEINGSKFQDVNKNGTQLDWILKSSKYQLFFYDSEQSIKPADIRKEDFDKIIALPSSKELKLISQMRAKGGNDYIQFINNLMYCLPIQSNSIFTSPTYDLCLFEDMGQMLKELRKKETEFGLCRTISGYSWPWKSKTEAVPDTIIDGVELTWNRTASDWINSTTDATEMGCIHTTQGYDLNYAAIIFGKEISYNPEKHEITIIKENYFDSKGKQAVQDNSELLSYIIKIYKTMMFRGIRGTYIYVCDDNLRAYFKKYIQTN